PLALALSTPLMVWLVRTAYADPTTNPAEMTNARRFTNRSVIEEHLLSVFIPAVYRHQPVAPAIDRTAHSTAHYQPGKADRWLAFLAGHLDRLHTRDLAWWQMKQAVPGTVTGLLFGLPTGLITGLGVGVGGHIIGFVKRPADVVGVVLATWLGS